MSARRGVDPAIWVPHTTFASDAEFERFAEIAKSGISKRFDAS